MINAFEQRRNRMYDLLNESGLNKAVIGNPKSVLYFTGIKIHPLRRFAALVLDAKNRTSLMILPVWIPTV